MGNNEPISIPDYFGKTCHQKFKEAIINRQQATLQLLVPYDKYYQQWKWNLYPIMTYQRHLVLPQYFRDQGVLFKACRADKDSAVTNAITVGYQPLIYTLQNEIATRKLTNRNFSNKQVWKIMKYILLALKDWTHAYQFLQIGKISPKNIVFNSKGQAKVVHLFSFPPDQFIYLNNKAMSYSQVNPQNAINLKKPSYSRQQIITYSLKQLGITLFSIVTLSQQIFNETKKNDINWRLQMLKFGNIGQPLLEMIMKMIGCQASIKRQQDLNELVQMAQSQSKSNNW